MLARQELRPASQAWALLTMHKAGSEFAGIVLRRLFAAAGYAVSDPCTTAFDIGMDEVQYVSLVVDSLAAPGVFSGPYRTASHLVGRRKDIRPIVHIRDPRDCLVSMYYSLGFSHVLPPRGPFRDAFLQDRTLARGMSIDEYVLGRLPHTYQAMKAMRSTIEARPDALLSRYECMVGDYTGWISGITERVAPNVPKEKLAKLAKPAEFNVRDNSGNHKRQVTPGDFRRKLSSRTQNELTERLLNHLEYFGFDSAFV